MSETSSASNAQQFSAGYDRVLSARFVGILCLLTLIQAGVFASFIPSHIQIVSSGALSPLAFLLPVIFHLLLIVAVILTTVRRKRNYLLLIAGLSMAIVSILGLSIPIGGLMRSTNWVAAAIGVIGWALARRKTM